MYEEKEDKGLFSNAYSAMLINNYKYNFLGAQVFSNYGGYVDIHQAQRN